MAKKDRFYMAICRSNDRRTLLRSAPELNVYVDVSEKKKKYLTVEVFKNGNLNTENYPPKTDDFNIIKPISKDVFFNNYHSFLMSIHQEDMSTGEIYFLMYNKRPYGAAWYSTDPKSKSGLQITLGNGPKDFTLVVGQVNRSAIVYHLRKAGNIIKAEHYNLFLKSVFDFLHDFENFYSNYPALMDQFNSVVKGDEPEDYISPTWQADNSIVIEKLTNRIASLRKRLIDLDTDTPEERTKMRGELDGLEFALNAIKNG